MEYRKRVCNYNPHYNYIYLTILFIHNEFSQRMKHRAGACSIAGVSIDRLQNALSKYFCVHIILALIDSQLISLNFIFL